MKKENVKKTIEKAQKDLKRLSRGKATTNQIRSEYGLEPIKDGDSLTTTIVKFGSYQE